MDNTPVYSTPCGEQIGTIQFRREKIQPGYYGCGGEYFVQRMDGTWFDITEVEVIP